MQSQAVLTAMGFPQHLIQQALSIAAQSQMLQIENIIELIVSMTAQGTRSAQRPHTFRSISAGGGGMAASSSPRPSFPRAALPLLPDQISGQVDIISGTVFKQRHTWGFPIQSTEQVEVDRLSNPI